MAKPQGPRPIIREIADPFGLEITNAHWSRGSTVTTKFFEDIFLLVVGRAYDGKLDKRGLAEALLIHVGATPTPVMFSTGSTVTNKYFESLKVALATYRSVEKNGLPPDTSEATEEEIAQAAEEAPDGEIEGRRLLVSHYRRERRKALSTAAKKMARKKRSDGLLACEICNSIPEKTYQEDIIEAHHRTPLNQLSGATKVMPADLAMVCPTCHRAVHKVDNCSMPEVAKRLKTAGLIKQ